MKRTCELPLVCVCEPGCVLSKKKKKTKTNCNVIYYKEEAIITGGSHAKVPSALSRGPLQDRLLLMCLLPIDHPGSSTRFILVIAASVNVGLWGKLHDEV